MRLGSLQRSACLLTAFPALVQAVQVRQDLACSKTHLIHIAKTGGTTVRKYYEKLALEDQKQLILHKDHHFVLGHGEPEDCYAFFVRDPIERWVSGFLDILRQFWKNQVVTEEMKFAFQTFKTPTDLAEALESESEAQRANAFRAINALEHARNTYPYYLPNLESNLHRILFVGETRNLQHDFEALCGKVGFAAPNLTRVGPRHVCPDRLEWMKDISSQAHENLHRLLKEDYEIMETLKTAGFIRSTNLHRHSCVAPQKRCVVMEADGRFRMVSGAHTAGHLDIFRLPNATRAEELPSAPDV